MDEHLNTYFDGLRRLRYEISEAMDYVQRVREGLVGDNARKKRVFLLINLDADSVADAVWGVLGSIDDAEKTIDSLRQLVPDPEYFPPLLIQSWEIGTWTESAP